MRKFLLFILLVFLSLCLFIRCGRLKNKGILPPNQIPIVYLSNIPPEDSKFSANPRIYWYGTDVDGYITRYQYVVIPESVKDTAGNIVDLHLIKKGEDGSVDSFFVKNLQSIRASEWVDSLISKHLRDSGFHVPAESMIVVDTPVTEMNVRMFAEIDTLKFVNQYIFVRAVDNLASTSLIWKPDLKGGHTFRRFCGNSHPPDTYIDKKRFNPNLVYYSLPETTKTWKGIKIFWQGSDSVDYPQTQPEFTYSWELLGPFAETLGINPHTASYPVVDSSYDTLLETRWVKEKSRLFANLKNYNEEGGGESGWYLFRVKAKDDAFVEDETPAYAFFQVVHPSFTYTQRRRVLLIDASIYKSFYAIIVPFEITRKYYKEILNSLSEEMGFDFDFWVDPYSTPFEKHLPPNEHTLSLYDLVIVMHYGGKEEGLSSSQAYFPWGGSAGTDTGYTQYKRYLDVGGRVWFIGANNFGLGAQELAGIHLTEATNISSGFYQHSITCDLARNYFGIYGIYYPNWASGITSQNEEFIAAAPYVPGSGFPELKVDSILVATGVWSNPNHTPQHKEAVPHVNYDILGPGVERLYTFISYKGTQSDLDGKPCGCRFAGSTFKTAEFCFPLFVMEQEKSKQVFRLMLEWFFEN
jgi:hypothetical protein